MSNLKPIQTSRAFSDAVAVIELARECGVPSLLKSAFYELVRSAQFWTAASKDRQAITLSDADLLTLYHARHELQCKWRSFALQPPPSCSASSSSQVSGCVTGEHKRRVEWQAFIMGLPDVLGTEPVDPINALQALNSNAMVQGALKKTKWCKDCVSERKKAWQQAKIQWWDALDELLKLVTTN